MSDRTKRDLSWLDEPAPAAPPELSPDNPGYDIYESPKQRFIKSFEGIEGKMTDPEKAFLDTVSSGKDWNLGPEDKRQLKRVLEHLYRGNVPESMQPEDPDVVPFRSGNKVLDFLRSGIETAGEVGKESGHQLGLSARQLYRTFLKAPTEAGLAAAASLERKGPSLDVLKKANEAGNAAMLSGEEKGSEAVEQRFGSGAAEAASFMADPAIFPEALALKLGSTPETLLKMLPVGTEMAGEEFGKSMKALMEQSRRRGGRQSGAAGFMPDKWARARMGWEAEKKAKKTIPVWFEGDLAEKAAARAAETPHQVVPEGESGLDDAVKKVEEAHAQNIEIAPLDNIITARENLELGELARRRATQYPFLGPSTEEELASKAASVPEEPFVKAAAPTEEASAEARQLERQGFSVEPEPVDETIRARKALEAEQARKAQADAIPADLLPEPKKPKTVDEMVKEGAVKLKAAEEPIEGPKTLDILKDELQGMKNRATRVYEHLGEGHAELKEGLRQYGHAGNFATDWTHRAISGILNPMKAPERSLFNDAVVAADLEHDVQAGKEIPFFEDPVAFQEFHNGIRKKVSQTPAVTDALAARKKVWNGLRDEYIQAADSMGLDMSHLKDNPDYFRHIVREYAEESLGLGKGQSLKMPTGRGFLKGRAGSTKDIVANYAQSEYQVMSQMKRDIESYRLLKKVKDSEDIMPRLVGEAQAKGMKVDDIIPDGFSRYNPGKADQFKKLFHRADSEVEDALRNALIDAGGNEGSVEEALTALNNQHDMVLPNEVVKTLQELSAPAKGGLVRKATGLWKGWTLNNPWTYLKYNLRNLSGDAEAAFVGNPSTFTKATQALKELKPVVYGDTQATGEVAEWMRRSGFSSGQSAQELGDIPKMGSLATVGGPGESKVAGLLKAPFRLMKQTGELREGTLRYASYLDYLEQLKAGKLKNYGASIPAEIDGLKDIRDKAAKLSNDLLGAYDQLTVTGKKLRETVLPFWSWKELNATRTYQLMKNAAADGAKASMIGRKLGAKTVGSALAVGRFALKASAMTGTLMAYNRLRYPKEEASLPDYVKNSPHLVLGTNPDGSTRYLSGLTAMGDIAAWVGLDSTLPKVREWMAGRIGLKDVLTNIAKAPVNQLAQGVTPLIKTTAEEISSKDFFPDAFNPRQIRDRGEHLFRSIHLAEEYQKATGIPGPPYIEKWKSLLWNNMDPGKGDYDRVLQYKQDFLTKLGKESPGGGPFTDRQNDLYYYKLAQRYGDKDGMKKYLNKYIAAGGDPSGIKKSWDAMQPLGGMSESVKQAFLQSLSKEELHQLSEAQKFYDHLQAGDQFTEKDVPADFEPPQPEPAARTKRNMDFARKKRDLSFMGTK